MDFDDTFCYVDVIDNYVVYFVQETWMKDELSNLLRDKHSDGPDALAEEVCHQEVITKFAPA